MSAEKIDGSSEQINWDGTGKVPGSAVKSARLLRERLLRDRDRPGYHFCIPEDWGRPGDPNGAFHANGLYHLMYLYKRIDSGFCWGHISSGDLVHWRHHPDAIGPDDADDGCFSGGAFVDDDGTAYLSYWMLHEGRQEDTGEPLGIGIARSRGPHYDEWEKLESNPVIRSTEWGLTETIDENGEKLVYGSADPSNIWKKDGAYYMETGNLLILNKYGREADSPADMRGDWVDLFCSKDLATWEYMHRFYTRNTQWTEDSEDDMCPSFLPFPRSREGGEPGGKYLQLFISHNKGCQYYIGEYRDDLFHPEGHGRMTWIDNTYFAPEALVDGKGRQIMWAWLVDNPESEEERGWSGVYGLPRNLWLGEDGTLRMAPVPELETLRLAACEWSDIALEDGEQRQLEVPDGKSCELEVHSTSHGATQWGVKVRTSPDGSEETVLFYDREADELVFDATKSGTDGRMVQERAPFSPKDKEALELRIFVDRSVVEVYANERQAICRRVFPARDDSVNVYLFSKGGRSVFANVRAWEMMPSNPC